MPYTDPKELASSIDCVNQIVQQKSMLLLKLAHPTDVNLLVMADVKKISALVMLLRRWGYVNSHSSIRDRLQHMYKLDSPPTGSQQRRCLRFQSYLFFNCIYITFYSYLSAAGGARPSFASNFGIYITELCSSGNLKCPHSQVAEYN